MSLSGKVRSPLVAVAAPFLLLLNSCSIEAFFPAERYKESLDRAAKEELAGDTSGAEKSYLQALKYSESLEREKSAMVAKKLGQLYMKLNKPDAAKPHFITALNVYQSLWKEGEGGLRNRSVGSELSDTMHEMANLNRAAGRFAEADAFYMQSLQSLDPGLGSHKEQNQIMIDYAESLKAQHKGELAAKILKQSQEFGAIEDTASGANLVRDPEQLVQDGEVECGALNYDKAYELFQAAIKKLGDNPQTAEQNSLLSRAYTGVGHVYDARKKYDEAKSALSKSLSLCRKYNLSQDILEVLERLAATEVHDGDLKSAAKHYEEALELQAKHDEKRDSYYRQSRRFMESLSGVYVNLKRYEEAESLINRKMELEITKYGPKTSKLADNYSKLAHIAELKGNIDQAIKYHEKAIYIFEHSKKERSRDMFLAYDDFTKFLHRHNKLQMAKKYEERMAQITKELVE